MKHLVFTCTIVFAMVIASPAFAGPYLNTAAMLLKEAFQSAEWVRGNLNDRELARVAQHVAAARVEAANHMSVPREVEKAHPHMLLVLTNLERAMDAAARGEPSLCLRSLDIARREQKTFRSILDQNHLSLPSARNGATTEIFKRAIAVLEAWLLDAPCLAYEQRGPSFPGG